MSEQQSGEHDNEHADVTVILLSSEWERHAELDFVDFLFQCGGSENWEDEENVKLKWFPLIATSSIKQFFLCV